VDGYREEQLSFLNDLPPVADSADLRETPPQAAPVAADELRKTADLGFTLPVEVIPPPAPEALPEVQRAPDYPVDALGGWLADAAKAIAEHVQLPVAVAAQSVLAAVSLAVQGHVNVKRGPYSGDDPVSLYFMSILESGDRKSSADKIALKPVREYEAEQRKKYKKERQTYDSAHTAWEMRKKSIEDSYKPKGKEQISEARQAELTKELIEHDAKAPVCPADPSLLMSEPNAEGIFNHLKDHCPSGGLFNDEALGFFGGHGMNHETKGRTIALLCKLWDSGEADKTRAQYKELIRGRRLTTHLMLQPVVATDIMSDPLLREQGFLPRFLIVSEPSMAGTRFIADKPDTEGAYSDRRTQTYFARMAELLNVPLNTPDDKDEGLRFATLELEGQSLQAWKLLHDKIEKELGADGRYRAIKGFGSKAAEQAARIAAIFSRIEGRDVITESHISRAGELMNYYLESMRVQTDNAAEDRERIEAAELLDWIKNNGGLIKSTEFKRLPISYRSAKKARSLLNELTDSGHIEPVGFGRNGPNEWEVCANSG